jgi:sugar lactone lactonase YvrE
MQPAPTTCLRRWIVIALVAFLTLVLVGTQAALAAFPVLQSPFEQQDFITGFPNDGHFGPTGIAFYKNGDILVADAADGNLYRLSPAGGEAGKPFAPGETTLGLVFAGDGKLYAARRSPAGLAELNPDTGEAIRTVASGFSNLIAGLAVDPQSTDIFVTDQGPNSYSSTPGVFRVRPSDGNVTVYASGPLFPAPDGLVMDTDGMLYVSNERGDGDILRIDRQGNASVLATLPGGPDGLAVGKPGSSLDHSLLINRNDGVISRIDLTQSPVTVSTFASGGTRGDFVAVSPDGFLFATQTDRIVKFSPAYFQVATGGRSSQLPLRIYLGVISAALLAAMVIAFFAWQRHRAMVRAQLAVVAANPSDLEILTELPRAAPGTSRPDAAGRLIARLSDGSTRVHNIGDGAVTIGARPDCAIALPRSEGVASYHARVWFRDGRYWLHHTGGPNYTTLVAGEPADWVTLDRGDEIQIGQSRFTFEQ